MLERFGTELRSRQTDNLQCLDRGPTWYLTENSRFSSLESGYPSFTLGLVTWAYYLIPVTHPSRWSRGRIFNLESQTEPLSSERQANPENHGHQWPLLLPWHWLSLKLMSVDHPEMKAPFLHFWILKPTNDVDSDFSAMIYSSIFSSLYYSMYL